MLPMFEAPCAVPIPVGSTGSWFWNLGFSLNFSGWQLATVYNRAMTMTNIIKKEKDEAS